MQKIITPYAIIQFCQLRPRLPTQPHLCLQNNQILATCIPQSIFCKSTTVKFIVLKTNGLFGSLKKEGESSRERESNSITFFGSFLKKEGEEFGGVSTTFNPSFLIPPNWRDLEVG